MSILDRDDLVTSGRPRSYGDHLPNKEGDFPQYKDGVEENWNFREAKAIRYLAAGYRPETVVKRMHLKLSTLERWMGNPYFMMEVQRLADHYLFKFRPKVLETVALRAIQGSPQHARLYLQVVRDLTPEESRNPSGRAKESEFDQMTDQEIDEKIRERLERLR